MYNGSEALGKHSFLFNHFWPLQFFCSRGLFILYIFLYTSSNTFSASNRSPWAPGGGILDQDFIHYSLVFQQEVWNSQHLSNTGYLRRVTQLLTRENYRIELRPAWHNYFTPCGQFGKLAAGRVFTKHKFCSSMITPTTTTSYNSFVVGGIIDQDAIHCDTWIRKHS